MRKIVFLLVFVLFPAAASAQRELVGPCGSFFDPSTREYCNLIAATIDMAQPRFGIALSGGNPVPGASSTLGMRIGSVPRISVAGRVTGAKVDLPSIRQRTSSGDIDFLLKSVNIDAAVGLFGGYSLLPTVGGFGSIDLLASAGALFVPDEGGFHDETKKSWAVGARVGLLRESFTAPGIAVTGMYRRVGDIEFGDREVVNSDAYFQLEDLSALSVRGTVGKKIVSLGAIAGVGYDRYSSDVSFRHTTAVPFGTASPTHRANGFDNDRVTFFGGLTWTLLVLSATGELGWQNGGDDFAAPLPEGRRSQSGNSAWYGSLALRLSI